MKNILPHLLVSLILFFHPCSTIWATEKTVFSRGELNQFIKDTPAFITQVKKEKLDERLIPLFLHPEYVHKDPHVYNILEKYSLTPERYAYIFSRVILGGFINDMGEFGDAKLDFMKAQLKKWQKSDEPEPERSQMIENLERSIRDLTDIVERTQNIPKTELLLMWDKKEILNDLLMGKLPIGRRKMKVLR